MIEKVLKNLNNFKKFSIFVGQTYNFRCCIIADNDNNPKFAFGSISIVAKGDNSAKDGKNTKFAFRSFDVVELDDKKRSLRLGSAF